MQQENQEPKYDEPELSATWKELLGQSVGPNSQQTEQIPELKSDPWTSLAHAKGVEEVDLQEVCLQMSAQEVERMLEIMPEEEQDQEKKEGKKQKQGE